MMERIVLSQSEVAGLVDELRKLGENECLEFKVDNSNPEAIGEYISALSNSAALLDKPRAYLVWGISDPTREVVGTSFEPATAKYGNESLENWLTRCLQPQVPFRFHVDDSRPERVVILEIEQAP